MIQANSQNFDTLIVAGECPVLVCFHASCSHVTPQVLATLGEFESAHHGEVTVVTVDCDDSTTIAQRYGVISMPMTLLLNRGAVVTQFGGTRCTRESLRAALDTLLTTAR